MFEKMNRLIVHSLLACQSVINNDRHCFECYGYAYYYVAALCVFVCVSECVCVLA